MFGFVGQTHAQQKGISPGARHKRCRVVAELTVTAKIAETWYRVLQLDTTSGIKGEC